MAGNYAQLLDIINNPTQHGLPAWDNDNKLIEGLTIKQYLLTIIQSLTAGYQFMGVATPSTNPGTPDQNVFYIGGAGTYANFGTSITVRQGQICIFKWNGSWTNTPIEIANSGFVNVNDVNGHSAAYGSASAARSAVPTAYRKSGLNITYLLSTGWVIDQFIGVDVSDWGVADNWKTIGPVSVTQNTNTGGHNLKIGSTKVASADNVFNVNLYNDRSEAYLYATDARNAVPTNMKGFGVIITYKKAYEGFEPVWIKERFVGDNISNWTDGDKWETLYNGIFNLMDYYGRTISYDSLYDAVRAVPSGDRHKGLIITFELSNIGYVIAQNINVNNWESTASWLVYDNTREVVEKHYGYYNYEYLTFKNNNVYTVTELIKVLPGQKILITITSGSAAYGIMGFPTNEIDINNLSVIVGLNQNYNNQIITIPNGVNYIIAQGRNENFPGTPYVFSVKLLGVSLSERLTQDETHIFQNKENTKPLIDYPLNYEIPVLAKGYYDLDLIFHPNNAISTTGLVKVNEGDKLKITADIGSGGYLLFGLPTTELNPNDVVILIGVSQEATAQEITIPSGVKYIVAQGRNEDFPGEAHTFLVVYESYTVNKRLVGIEDFLLLLKKDESVFKGKKFFVIGDSIPHGQSMSVPTGATQCYQPFPALIAKGLGMILTNYAIGGSTIAVSPLILGGSEKSFGGFVTEWNTQDKDTSKYYVLITGEPSEEGVATYGGTTYYHNGSSWVTSSIASRTPISERYKTMGNDADIIMVFCGTNDFQYNWTPIGSIEDNLPNTFYGALKTLCEGLLDKYFGKLIFFCTPIKRCQTQTTTSDTTAHNGGNYGTIDSQNTFNKTLKNYGDIIKEVCARYSIPVIDTYAESGLNPQLASQALLFDLYKTHPTQQGHEVMAKFLSGKLKTFIGPTEY